MKRKQKLGEILQDQGVLSKSDADSAAEHGLNAGKRIGEVLIEHGIDDQVIYRALAAQQGMEYFEITNSVVNPEVRLAIGDKLIKQHNVVPVDRENGLLKIAIGDPLDLDTIDTLRFRFGKIFLVVSTPSCIRDYIDKHIDSPEASLDILTQSLDTSLDASIDQNDAKKKINPNSDLDAPIIKLINLMIGEAVRARASDIHVEAMARGVRVRYRIDGICVERDTIPKKMQKSVMARLKIMAGIDIAEKRVPQDGRIKLSIDKSDIDFRVSCCPSVHGESIVLRILRGETTVKGVQELGLESDDYEKFLQIIKKPNGIFLVTGPTGSGKTTTLYSALQDLNRPNTKIITAEDPVEYVFPGMNQCQVNDDIDFGFAEILRSMLRQAPNIILVGEIRDLEVGEIAIQAALTGHLVFSTLHTNDAASALTRLIDLGIKPFLVASSVQAIMAQRLVRELCVECRQEDTNPDPKLLKTCGMTDSMLKDNIIYKPVGCSHCNNTGYRGRKGIFELLVMNSELRELAFNRAGIAEIRRAARSSGAKTLLMDGQQKVLRGITSLEELSRLAQSEVKS